MMPKLVGVINPCVPITPHFPFGSNCEIVGDYVEKQMLAHHFSHYHNQRCRQMVSKLAGVINPITSNFLSGANCEIAMAYVENKMLAHHFFTLYTTGDADGWCQKRLV